MVKVQHLSLLFLISAMVLLAGCGRDKEQRTIVENFIESDMGITNYDVVDWSKPKIARFVTDSMVMQMRNDASRARLVKGSPKYVAKTDSLQYMSVVYVVGEDTVRQTFYLDDKLSGIVSFK